MSKDTEKTKGELFVITSGFFWASFSVLVTLNYGKVSGLYSLFYSIIFAIIFFAVMVHFKKLWHELNNKLFWKYVFYIGFTNGFLFYVFYLLGLKMTTPNNVSLLGQTEILFSFLFLNIYNKEYISKEHKVGIFFMIVGAMIILLPGFSKFNIGDLLIILAVMVGPIGNYFQKKTRQIASAPSLLLGRNLVSLPLIFLMIIFLEPASLSIIPNAQTFIILLINGFVVIGISRILWIEGIHRVSVTKATAFGALNPLFTMILSWSLLGQMPTIVQLTAFVPLFIGILFLTDNMKLKFYSPLP